MELMVKFIIIIFFISNIRLFSLSVTYRLNCNFNVDDSERDLSSRFIDMDENYFTPTMAKHRQEQEYLEKVKWSSSNEGSPSGIGFVRRESRSARQVP